MASWRRAESDRAGAPVADVSESDRPAAPVAEPDHTGGSGTKPNRARAPGAESNRAGAPGAESDHAAAPQAEADPTGAPEAQPERAGALQAKSARAGAPGTPPSLGGLRHAGRTGGLTRAILDGFKRHDLLTYSSAISFQILTAIIPFLLFALALAGLLHLGDVWTKHLEPQIAQNVSPPVFAVISSAVDKAFAGGRILWATLGGALALWQVSGAVRAVMGALGGIYGAAGERPFIRRYLVSFALSIEVGACFVLAALFVLLAPFVSMSHHPGLGWEVLAFVVRWAATVAFLSLAVGLLVRHAPGTHQTLPWVSLGATIVIGSWVLVSVGFYLYLTELASYESVFGSLAAVIVAMGYLYVSTTVFLFGAQLDAILRERSAGHAASSPHSYGL